MTLAPGGHSRTPDVCHRTQIKNLREPFEDIQIRHRAILLAFWNASTVERSLCIPSRWHNDDGLKAILDGRSLPLTQ